jgi:asparagine synthetase B (glutamine-hydrolysing)
MQYTPLCDLLRHPFGHKAFYYADYGGTLRFASQMKALLTGGGVDTVPAPERTGESCSAHAGRVR